MKNTIALFVFGVLASIAADPQPKAELPEPRIVIGACKIDRIIDGDTVDLEIRRIIRVRFLNCWAPETHKTKYPHEKHLGQMAEQHLASLTKPGDICRLEVLPDGDDHAGDGLTFGRVVGNVYLEDSDGRSLNKTMNASGLTYRTKAELVEFLESQQ